MSASPSQRRALLAIAAEAVAARPEVARGTSPGVCAAALVEASDGMRLRTPGRSAGSVLVPWQRRVALTLAAITVLVLVVAPSTALQILTGAFTALYLATVGYRVLLLRRGLAGTAVVRVSDEDALALDDGDLPRYTILVPAFGEPEVVGSLIGHLGAIRYPRDRLEILLLLEADDEPTIAAARAAGARDKLRVVLVPPGEPRTKPKACNYGLLMARGEITTIYDAEDQPDPLQPRRVAAAFARLPDDVACLQARLVYRNASQNMLTRWFATEYAMWFSLLLPGLVALRAPIPLGGTSNHIKTEALRAAGAWDPYNVTEDADLGIRLHRSGYRCGVLDSWTSEEANSDPINWIRQRSRWLKGYSQTWLVHMRTPRETLRELGPAGFVGFHLMIGGTPLLAVANPLFWGLGLIWIAGHSSGVRGAFGPWTYYAATISFLIGNFTTLYMHVVAARVLGMSRLLLSCMLLPAYWLLMSIAAIKALVQLVTAPSYWEKTAHGLDATTERGS